MVTADKIGLKGKIEIVQYRDGKIILDRKIDNLITAAGMAEVAGLVNEVTSGGFKWVAIGSAPTAPSTADTTLGTEITTGGGTRASADTISRVTTTHANDTSQWVHTYTFTAAHAIKESGLFDASSGGILLARGTFGVINVASADSLQMTWKDQVS